MNKTNKKLFNKGMSVFIGCILLCFVSTLLVFIAVESSVGYYGDDSLASLVILFANTIPEFVCYILWFKKCCKCEEITCLEKKPNKLGYIVVGAIVSIAISAVILVLGFLTILNTGMIPAIITILSLIFTAVATAISFTVFGI